MRKQTEAQLQVQVADYIRTKYPNVLFHSDYGSGVKLTMSQAVMQKRQNGGRRSWPDVFIAKGRMQHLTKEEIDSFFESFERPEHAAVALFRMSYRNGLFIELKREGTKIYRKDGKLVADAHIREQFDLLEELADNGYEAEFACGFEEAKRIIDDYLA